MNSHEARWPAHLAEGADRTKLLALFESARPARVEELSGTWRGLGVPSGHPLDGLLELAGWYGKRFDCQEEVHPLLFADRRGVFCVSPSAVPWSLMPALVTPLRRRSVRTVVRHMVERGLLRCASTRRPGARLRMMDFRGTVGAAMVYDALPIEDHFRWIEPCVLLGLMDARGFEPFFFMLKRESPAQ